MKQTWRWFGPEDPVPLHYAKQAGATGIVSALHHLYRGEAWPLDEVRKRSDAIAAAGMEWSVVESIPMHNSIKLRAGDYQKAIGAWKDSLAAIAKVGVKIVAYNFMPVVDWVRTDIAWRLPSTGYAVRFDAIDHAAYDLCILKRPNAEAGYTPERIEAARARYAQMSEAQKELLEKNVGDKGLEHVFTYVPASDIEYPVNFGMNLPTYKAAWDKKYPDGKLEFGLNAVAGYTTGLVIEKALSVATSLDQMELRRAVFSLSGNLKTLCGPFALDETGGQTGELTPLGQLELDDHGHLKFVSIYPHDTATGKPVYPRP